MEKTMFGYEAAVVMMLGKALDADRLAVAKREQRPLRGAAHTPCVPPLIRDTSAITEGFTVSNVGWRERDAQTVARPSTNIDTFPFLTTTPHEYRGRLFCALLPWRRLMNITWLIRYSGDAG